ncbi:helix-turn-helix domain-containing protein [Rhodobacteraceae bacterium F11138]|nr:helix-turn-helix domain-containing protein [Rhodobacteraceae bacterium F11138]
MPVPAKPYPRTPAEVEPYVAILGVDLGIQFLLTFGGAEMYIPRNPKTRSRVAALVGAEKTAELAQSDYLLPRRVPLVTPWLSACLHVQGWNLADIARRLRVTDVTVRKHLNRYGMRGNGP